ncbi:tRNA(Met) cytidine acetyltransferase TmcA [Clarias magur]|uniref:tRNA(Met) cytidine acetyltransferase TmcA n=1 Tax=Clarias magur TaxID=1594786 RepID=A0A8J4UJ53_CLAMG|nr:tRNA(Met) cytidine acetyltransferase TmcA [Clarias magur]
MRLLALHSPGPFHHLRQLNLSRIMRPSGQKKHPQTLHMVLKHSKESSYVINQGRYMALLDSSAWPFQDLLKCEYSHPADIFTSEGRTRRQPHPS